jgi:hypothetical protein
MKAWQCVFVGLLVRRRWDAVDKAWSKDYVLQALARFEYREPSRRPCRLHYRLLAGHCLTVDVHRYLDRSMPHELLLHLHWRARFVEPRAIGVAECMRPHVLADACGDRGAFDVRLLDLLLVIWLARGWIHERPVFGHSEKRLAAPSQKDFHEPWIKRNMVARALQELMGDWQRWRMYSTLEVLRQRLRISAAGPDAR